MKDKLSQKDRMKIKEGYGQGTKENYKPWISITSFSSKGLSGLKRGTKVDRFYTLFSELEYYVLRILENLEKITDIQEQFPLLPLSSTLDIAKRLGLKHPTNPRTHQPNVMTTDFIVTFTDHKAAFCVKETTELESKRVLEKISIEKKYWEEQERTKFFIVTEEDIDYTLAKNLDRLSEFYYPESLGSIGENQKELMLLAGSFLDFYNHEEGIVQDIIKNFEKVFFLESGDGFRLYQYLLANRIIRVDLSRPLNQIVRGKK